MDAATRSRITGILFSWLKSNFQSGIPPFSGNTFGPKTCTLRAASAEVKPLGLVSSIERIASVGTSVWVAAFIAISTNDTVVGRLDTYIPLDHTY